MQQIHQVEQRLANDFEHAEIHDLCFVVLELRQPMIKFRSGVNLEMHSRSLPRLQWKPGIPIAPSIAAASRLQDLLNLLWKPQNGDPKLHSPWH